MGENQNGISLFSSILERGCFYVSTFEISVLNYSYILESKLKLYLKYSKTLIFVPI